jgi:hypothetical protein
MHSCLSRSQAVFGFFTTVLSCVAALIALSVLFYPADNVVTTVDLRNVQVYVWEFLTWLGKICLAPRVESAIK